MDSRHAFRFLLIGGAVAGVIAVAASLSPGAAPHREDWIRAVPRIVILVVIAARLATSAKPLGPSALRMAMILALGAFLVAGYSYKADLQGLGDRLMGSLVPSRGVEIAPGILRFEADDQGQFAVDATVDGISVHFLVDTGASGIVLAKRDAGRLGFDRRALSFSERFSTANGEVRAAPVTLGEIRIGSFTADRVRAFVNEGDLDQSLLGISYLSSLGRIEIRGNILSLERPGRSPSE